MLVTTLRLAFLALVQAPDIVPLGGGTAGFGGVPRIDLDGAPIVGRPLRIGLEDGLANSVAVLAASVNGAPVPSVDTGATTHLLPPFFAFGILPLDDEGRSPKLIAAPVTPAFAGASFFVQGAVFDPHAMGSLAATEGLAFTLGFGGAAAADPAALFDGAALPPGTYPEAIEMGDFDGDGHTDVVALLTSMDTVRTFLGDGAGGFVAFADASVGGLPVGLARGDLNGNGIDDFVTTNLADATVSLLLGLGDGTFIVQPPIAVGIEPQAATIADLDGDGDCDIAVVCSSPLGPPHQVRILLGDGSGLFTPAGIHALPAHALAIAAGGIDPNASTDLVVALAGSNEIGVLLGTGGGGFAAPITTPTGFFPSTLAVADLDSNGALDALVGNANSKTVSVLEGLGDGTFALTQLLPVEASPTSVRLAHLDLDGEHDVVIGGSPSGGLTAAIGTGTGSFGPTIVTAFAPGAGAVGTGDIDGNGGIDVVMALETQGALVPFMSNGDGSFEVATLPTVDTVFAPIDMRFVDADRDGIEDLFVVGGSSSGQLQFLAGSGDGTFAHTSSQSLSVTVRDFEFADMDGDGVHDLVVLSSSSNAVVSVRGGAGDGTFSLLGGSPIGDSPMDLVVADFDSDGRRDVALPLSATDRVAVLLGEGDGSFAAPVEYAVGQDPRSITAGDLDGDGDMDLVVGNAHVDDVLAQPSSTAGDVSVLLNGGDGTFAPQVVHATGPAPRQVRLADLDGDGALDLVTLDVPWAWSVGVEPSVSVLPGVGDGGFAPAASFDGGPDPFEFDIADLDGDLIPDLVVVNAASDVFALMRGVGDGSFEVARRFYTGASPRHVRAIDVTQDRVPDVLTLEWEGAAVTIFENRLVD